MRLFVLVFYDEQRKIVEAAIRRKLTTRKFAINKLDLIFAN